MIVSKLTAPPAAGPPRIGVLPAVPSLSQLASPFALLSTFWISLARRDLLACPSAARRLSRVSEAMLSSELSELNRVIKDLSGGGHHDAIRAERIGATNGEADMDQLLLDSPDATPSKGMLGDSLSSHAGRLPGGTPGASVSANTPFSPTSELERAAQHRHGGGRVVDRQYDGAPAGAATAAQVRVPS